MTESPAAIRTTRILPVTAFEQVGDYARLLQLGLDGPWPFRAGQAALVGRHGQSLRKPYSLACSPGDSRRTGAIEFLVGLDEDGEPDAHLAGAAPGGRIGVDGPFGTFCVPDRLEAGALLFVAGGTGIAPLRAMLHDVLARAATPGPVPAVDLVYSVRTKRHVAFEDEWRDLDRAGRIRLTLAVTREPANAAGTASGGRIGPGLFDRLVTAPHETTAFICGPAGFVESVLTLLHRAGIDRRRIVREEWS